MSERRRHHFTGRECQAAALLAEARLARRPIPPLPEACRPATEDEGYWVQEALHQALAPALGPVAGHKIGCTTPVMQAYLGIASPCAGGVLAATVHSGRARLRHGTYRRVGVECEIAVRLGADLVTAPPERAGLRDAVAECLVAMEIVDDRYADFRTVGVPTLIADDFFGAGCVLGEPVSGWRTLELAALAGVTRVNGVERGRGVGRAVMGDPLAALAWLAERRASLDLGLRAGEFVLLGSLVETCWLDPGDRASVAIEGLGEVEAIFLG